MNHKQYMLDGEFLFLAYVRPFRPYKIPTMMTITKDDHLVLLIYLCLLVQWEDDRDADSVIAEIYLL